MTVPLEGARVLVMGLGRFGGGLGVTRWLVKQGAKVTVTDLAPAEKLASSIEALRTLIDQGRVALRLGAHDEQDFTRSDLVVANPAVPMPWLNPFLRAAGAAGVPVTTEIRLALERLDRQRVIGVTGSAGKSTTSAMIHHLLRSLGHEAAFGGNIGGSLLEHAASSGPKSWTVVELSSAQLHWLGAGVGDRDAPGVSPRIAVITNIAPNHLDWHGTFEHYRESKLNIARWHGPHDKLLVGDGEMPPNALNLRVPGAHNQRNAWLALRAARSAVDLVMDDATNALSRFPGLPHRLQLVAERRDVRFFNDSKSTTPEATVLAVEAFDDPSRVHLIAGGSDKGADLSPIARLSPRLAGLYTIGATGPTIASNAPAHHPAHQCATLERAIERALDRSRAGDIILLSPGCASFDQFANYEARGETFTRLVASRSGATAI